MKRNVAYIKIAVCTQDPYIGKQIREYAAGFEIRGNVEIEVEVMKNCYPLAKKILRREYYDIICLGRKLWDIDSYTLASSIRTTDRETIFFPSGLEPADTGPDTEHRTDIASSSAIAERRIPKRTLPRAQPSGTGASLSFFCRTGGERTYSVS